MGFVLFLIWLALAVYSLAALCILTIALCRYLWSLLPEDSEVADRRARIERDRAVVEAGMGPGYRR